MGGIVLTMAALLQDEPSGAEGCAACATCGGFVAAPFIVAGVILILNIALMAWVGRDAKARGLEGATWLILMFFTGPIGLIVYLFARPHGALTQCQYCQNKRLAAAALCPHCGR
jgi:hypothetical protein